MSGLFSKVVMFAVIAFAMAGGALAQDNSLRERAGAKPVQTVGGLGVKPTPSAPPSVKPGGSGSAATTAPPEATALETAQNALRAKQGRSAMAWSAVLAAEADAGAARATEGVCTLSSTLKAQAPGSANVYWSAPTRRVDGAAKAQNLLPGFVASEWRLGKADFDPATGKCRQAGGACDAYARMMAAETKAVGCAVKTCPSQAQIYICRYGK